MKAVVTLVLLTLLAGLVQAQDTNQCGTASGCACATGSSVFVILPDDVSTNLQNGDVITAKYGDQCIGQRVYAGGQANSITVWGRTAQSNDMGIPEGETVTYSVHRPTNQLDMETTQTVYSSGDGTYDPNNHFVMEMSEFMVGAALPVELASFQAITNEDNAVLTWKTLSETNNAGFEVQQVIDGTFAPVSFVEGAGMSDEPQQYQVTVPDLAPGTHRFRLKQVDFDGTFALSPEVEVTVELPTDVHLSGAYPNPFNPETSLSLTLREAQDVEVGLYDIQGRQVQVLYTGHVGANEATQLRVDGSGLASGLYLIRAHGRTFATTQTVTLMK